MRIIEDFLDKVDARSNLDKSSLIEPIERVSKPLADSYESRLVIRYWWSGNTKKLLSSLEYLFENNPAIENSSNALVYVSRPNNPIQSDRLREDYIIELTKEEKQSMSLDFDSVVIAFNPRFNSVRQFISFLKALYRIVCKFGGMRRKTENIIFQTRKDASWPKINEYQWSRISVGIDFRIMDKIDSGTFLPDGHNTQIQEYASLVTLAYMFVDKEDTYDKLLKLYGEHLLVLEENLNYYQFNVYCESGFDQEVYGLPKFNRFMKDANISVNPNKIDENYLSYTCMQFITLCGSMGLRFNDICSEGVEEFNNVQIKAYESDTKRYWLSYNAEKSSIFFIKYLGLSKPTDSFTGRLRRFSVLLKCECILTGKAIKSNINKFIKALDLIVVGGLPKDVKTELKNFITGSLKK